MKRRGIVAVVALAVSLTVPAVAASPARPMQKPYRAGASGCLSRTACYSVEARAGYLDRAKLTAAYSHGVSVLAGTRNINYMSVYASARGRVDVEWEMACQYIPTSRIIVTQGTFSLGSRGRKRLGTRSSSGSSCTAKASARGRGRVYVELDGEPQFSEAIVNAADPPDLP